MQTPDVLQRFGELPFQVEVDLGMLTMTLGEVFGIKAGTVLRTDHPAGAPLTIRVGDVRLAEADPIVIEDAVSMRIKRLLPGSKPTADNHGTT